MTGPGELGLSAMRALNGYEQAFRRESPEWRSMSKEKRRDEILSLVVEASKGSYVRDEKVRANKVAELVIKRRDEWPYWVHRSKEKSQEGWFAWHVVHRMVLRLWEEDPEQLTKPPLSEWMARYARDPHPARGEGSPLGAKSELHRVAVLGVYALLEADICDLTGKKKGQGRSCCDLVAGALDVDWRTVYEAWRAHQKTLAACVDVMIALREAGQDAEPCPVTALEALMHAASVYRVAISWVIVAWRKDGKLVEDYSEVEFGSVRRPAQDC